MIEAPTRRRWTGRAIYVALILAVLFIRLLPLHPGRVSWPGPDLLLCLTYAWVLRRPDQVPVLLIAAVFLLADILTLQPVGLAAAITVMGTEAARVREARWREAPFMVEWLRVSLLIAATMLGYRFAMALFLLPVSALGQITLQWLATVAAYPVVVFLGQTLLGLRRMGPAEAEAMGQR